MLPNAREFAIEGGSFNEAQNQHVDHSTNYQYNITFSSEALHPKAGAPANHLATLEALNTFFSQTNLSVATEKSSSSLTSDGSEGSMSSTPPIDCSTVSGAIERPVAIAVPEQPVKVIQELEKRLIIHTGVDKALKKLKRSIKV